MKQLVSSFLLVALASVARADTATAGSGSVALSRWPILPEAIASFGAAEAGGWLYVYGGHTGRVHAHSRDNLTGAFLRLSLVDGTTWEQLPAGPPLQGLALVAHEGALIRVGGLSARNAGGEKEDLYSVADVARFDPVKRAWTPLPPLPEPRSSHDAAVLDGKLYVVGGWSLAGEAAPFLPTNWVLDLRAEQPEWKPVPPLPVERRALCLAVAGGKLWALGGMTTEDELSPRVDVFDPAKGTWSEAPALPFHGFGCAALGVNDELFVSGQRSDLWRLEAGAERWERVGSLTFPRYFHRFVAWGPERLLAVGGSGAGGAHLRVCEPVATLPGEGARGTVLELPIPGRAKNRQSLLLRGDSLWVAGGNDGLEQHDFTPPRFLSEAWRIDLGALQVEPVGPLPAPRQTMTTALIPGRRPSKDKVVAIGGFSNPGDGARAQTSAFALDPNKAVWSELPAALPSPRTQLGLAVHDGTVWVLGGVDFDARRPRADGFKFPTEVLTWRPGQEGFEVRGQLPRPRRAFGCAVLDGKAYLVGGMKESFGLVPEVDVLDLATGTWSQVAAPARTRISPELVAFRGRLWLCGGSALPRPDASVQDVAEDPSLEVFDPATGRWELVLADVGVPTRHAAMFAWRDRLLVYSAHRDDARAIRLLVLDPEARPGDELRRVRELVGQDGRSLADEQEHLAIEQEEFERQAAGKPETWVKTLEQHRGVVRSYAEVVARHAALLRELAAVTADGDPALGRIEAASKALVREAHELYEEHERLEDKLE